MTSSHCAHRTANIQIQIWNNDFDGNMYLERRVSVVLRHVAVRWSSALGAKMKWWKENTIILCKYNDEMSSSLMSIGSLFPFFRTKFLALFLLSLFLVALALILRITLSLSFARTFCVRKNNLSQFVNAPSTLRLTCIKFFFRSLSLSPTLSLSTSNKQNTKRQSVNICIRE